MRGSSHRRRPPRARSSCPLGGDGLGGRSGRRAARIGAARRPARRARQRLRAGARHPAGPRARPAACWRRAPSERLDLGEANGRPFACIASCGYDSEANRIANEARLIRGQPGLCLRRDPGAGALAAGALPGPPRRRRARVRGLHAGRRQHLLLRRRHADRPRGRPGRRHAGRGVHQAIGKAAVPR